MLIRLPKSCWIVLALLTTSCASCRKGAPSGRAHVEYPPTIGVTLLSDADVATVSVPGPFKAVRYPGGQVLASGSRLSNARVTCAGDAVQIAGCGTFPAAGVLLVSEKGRPVALEGKGRYRGDLLLRRSPGGLEVVNRVDLESYLMGVIGREMKAGWPSKALKAQAVAARTYALYSWVRRPDAAVHVADDVSSQVYGGVDAESRNVRRAVQDTSGIVLLDQGRIFPAFFHSCCGGHTEIPETISYFSAATIPCLRGVPCPYCQSSSWYRWSRSFDGRDVANKMSDGGFPVGPRAVSVELGEKTASGRWIVVRVNGIGGSADVSTFILRKLLGTGRLPSTLFESVTNDGGRISFRGRGFGHGVGLCQYGAKGMADDGADFKRIIRHYYPGAALVRVR